MGDSLDVKSKALRIANNCAGKTELLPTSLQAHPLVTTQLSVAQKASATPVSMRVPSLNTVRIFESFNKLLSGFTCKWAMSSDGWRCQLRVLCCLTVLRKCNSVISLSLSCKFD